MSKLRYAPKHPGERDDAAFARGGQGPPIRAARDEVMPAPEAASGPASTLLRLQRTAGNRAVTDLVSATVQTARTRTAEASIAQPLQGGLPKTPSIAASASGISQGGSFGDHSTVFLAAPKGGKPGGAVEYYFIDLIIDGNADRKRAIDIRIRPLKGGWPDPATSTTWNVSGTGALAALAKAQEFEANRSKYTYSRLGIGPRRYNCALFAEKILQAAGVKRSAGLIASTPLELALGKKLPGRRKKQPKPAAEPAIPAQYDI